MNQEQEKLKLIEKFWKMSFIDKKKECLYILKNLYWISEVVNILWNRVYNVMDESWTSILTEAYVLLLDALYYAKDKKWERAVEKLQKVRESLNSFKQEEESERLSDNQNLDELLNNLDY